MYVEYVHLNYATQKEIDLNMSVEFFHMRACGHALLELSHLSIEFTTCILLIYLYSLGMFVKMSLL